MSVAYTETKKCYCSIQHSDTVLSEKPQLPGTVRMKHLKHRLPNKMYKKMAEDKIETIKCLHVLDKMSVG